MEYTIFLLEEQEIKGIIISAHARGRGDEVFCCERSFCFEKEKMGFDAVGAAAVLADGRAFPGSGQQPQFSVYAAVRGTEPGSGGPGAGVYRDGDAFPDGRGGGLGDGTLAPQETATRAQVAQLMMNFDRQLA